MLKAKYVTIRTEGGGGVNDGYVGEDAGGMVRVLLDELDFSPQTTAELKTDGAIIASLPPQTVITGISISCSLMSNVKVKIGTNGSVHTSSIVSNGATGQTINNILTTHLNFGVSNKKLGVLARNDNTTITTSGGITTTTHSGLDVNREGLVDIVLRATKDDGAELADTGMLGVVIYYI